MILKAIKKDRQFWVTTLLFLGVMVLLTSQVHAAAEKGRQILINPDFTQPLKGGNPPGWFRAMMPHLTEGFEAGLKKDEKGPYLYLQQKGVKGKLFNNWAQRIEKPPMGGKMNLEAEVAMQGAVKGAVVMIMFFDKDGKVLGVASSEGKVNLTGTKPWTKVELEAVVPENCDIGIVRLGLSPGPGKIMVRYAQLYLQVSSLPAGSNAQDSKTTETRRQILVNPDFQQGLLMGNPPGWFRAMMPHLTEGFRAGLKKDEKGPYLYLQQKGVKGNLFNNWAQQIEKPSAGAKMNLEAEVATQRAIKGAVVMLMFFDKDGKVLGGASSEGKVNLTGTKPWTKVELEAVVPENCDVGIVRLGLGPGPGKIMVRYAQLYVQE